MSNLPAIKREATQSPPHENNQLTSFELEGEKYGIDVPSVLVV